MLAIALLLASAVFAASASLSLNSVFIPATDPRVLVSGRASFNADGSRSFDWEGVAFTVSVINANFFSMNVTSTSSGLNRVITHISNPDTTRGLWYEQTRHWILPGNSVLVVAANLDREKNTLRVFFELEPHFAGIDAPSSFFTVNNFVLDSGDAVETAPLSRRIEILGDSISAGYGSVGVDNACPVRKWSSSNYGTYGRMFCDYFKANCSVLAWSGRGVRKGGKRARARAFAPI